MARGEISLGFGGWVPTRDRSYMFQVGPIHYRVLYSLELRNGKKYVDVELVLESVDSETHDPNLDYECLEVMRVRRPYWPEIYYQGYGVARTPVYVFKTLANLAAILKEITRKEKPDYFRCTFPDVRHRSFWERFLNYLEKPPWNLQWVMRTVSRSSGGGEDWVIGLKK